MDERRRPTREELIAAAGRVVADIIGPGLKVLFCGINPGLYSGAVGHHFARPGNRFWPALHAGGFTPRLPSPFEEAQLLRWGYGITNIVGRATATAAELDEQELRAGARALEARVLKHRPRFLAILGVTAYRIAFQRPGAKLGLQEQHRIGRTAVWVLPNPSGLNAHHQAAGLARLFAELRRAAGD
jgi:double-stranded uracil-DNA glycosylase